VPGYDFCETDRSNNGSKTYEVLMISGSPYSSLVAINGRALPKESENEERQKLEKTAEHRRLENVQHHQKRVDQYERERRRDQVLLEQITNAMNYTLAGTETVGGYQTYLLDANHWPDIVLPAQPPRCLPKCAEGYGLIKHHSTG